jgi:hypothetical protein
MPPHFIAKLLQTLKPHAARSTFKALRAICQFAVTVGIITTARA